jgi:ABC-type multidrug transport system fused ATPase/permease subunit
MHILRKIRYLLTPAERSSAVVLLGLMIIGMVLEMLGIGLVIPAIALLMQDDLAVRYPVVAPVLARLGNPSPQALIVGAMLGLSCAYLAKNLFLTFFAWRQMRFAFGVQAHLSQLLFTTYLRQPYTFHLQHNTAQLIRNTINEVQQLWLLVLLPGMVILSEGMVLLGIASLLLVVEPLGALIVVLVLSIATWGFHRWTRAHITAWGEARQYHDGLRIQHLQQGLGGAKEVKLLGREGDFLAQYHVHNVQSARMGQFQSTLQQLPRLWLELLAVLGMTTLVLTMLAQGRDMSNVVPTLGLFAAAAFRLMPSVNRVLSAVISFRYGLPVINTLHEELKLFIPEPVAQDNNGTPAFEREIYLTNIIYAYPNASVPALNGLSITIQKGESVGFFGPSGSGKSTLVDVVLGLLTPNAGKVLVDGQDIQQNLRAWQDQIGYVPQFIYLTDDTLRRNVAFGLPNEQIDDGAVNRAIKAAQLEEFVAGLPDGLETIVGEQGVRLSGGQRQRIGIARALYHDPLLLVLDEATSALDTATERSVMDAVCALRGDKTLIIVAHRLSTVEQCDRLFRLELGRVADEGEAAAVLGRQMRHS